MMQFGGFGGGNQMMKPLGQMWNGQQGMGQPPTGQFPLNPGQGPTMQPLQMGPMQGQLPSYQMPQGGYPQMPQLPQGAPMGAQNAMGRMGGMMDAFNQWRGQMQDYRQQRPQFAQGMNPQDFRSQIQDYRALRPAMPNFGSMFQR